MDSIQEINYFFQHLKISDSVVQESNRIVEKSANGTKYCECVKCTTSDCTRCDCCVQCDCCFLPAKHQE